MRVGFGPSTDGVTVIVTTITLRLQVLGLLMERLGNEMTRMATLKALAAISVSPLKVNLRPILPHATEELAVFLRQQSRPLKQTTLETLLALIGR